VTALTYIVLPGVLLTAALASAQAPPASQGSPAAASPPAATAPSATQAALDSPAYTYDPQGRRDPFVSLAQRGSAQRPGAGTAASGVSGLEASEMVLKGTMQSRTGYVALVEGTNKKTYIVKTGDKLLDGTVRTITADTMVILQQVNDPLSLEKQREVRKMLRQTDEVK
jgi:type IV pilus assembly protein PilP